MLELDLILLPFLDNIYPALEPADKESYWQLLACEDQDLYTWFMRRENPPNIQLQRIVELVRHNTGMPIQA
jgi:antitoxin CptB